MADLSTFEKITEFEDQKESILELKGRLEEAELKLIEGEKLRKKLHNTIQVKTCHFVQFPCEMFSKLG